MRFAYAYIANRFTLGRLCEKKKTCKKNIARCNKVFIITELLNIAVNDLGPERSACYKPGVSL